jgi:hypothetical protein
MSKQNSEYSIISGIRRQDYFGKHGCHFERRSKAVCYQKVIDIMVRVINTYYDLSSSCMRLSGELKTADVKPNKQKNKQSGCLEQQYLVSRAYLHL